MGTQRIDQILLRERKKRLQKRELLFFWDFLGLHVSVGYDLAYAWPEAIEFFSENSKNTGLENLRLRGSEDTLMSLLARLEVEFSPERYRFMFTALKQLYSKGAPLTPAVRAFSGFVRREIEQDFEKHLRDSPTRANLCLLVFFLPPTLALLLVPLLTVFKKLW